MVRRGPLGDSVGAALVAALLVLGTGVRPLAAQTASGANAEVVGGAALGLYSGGVLALTGSLLPCNRALLGPKCAAVAGALGAGVGLVAGRALGANDADAVDDRARGALYGAAIGGAVGMVLQQAVRQYGWIDAATVALYGGAVGAAPRGTLIGTGAGAALGGLLWAGHRRDGLANLLLLTVVGGAVGGLYDWVDGAVDAGGAAGPPVTASFSVPVG